MDVLKFESQFVMKYLLKKENDLNKIFHIALLVKRVTWIKRCKKLAKVDPCFSFNKLTR